tara:strand:- start:718 stop:1035 length:318 start_codon:yes stop_codon:yes gene_type:complete
MDTESFNDAVSSAPPWFLRVLVAGMVMMTLGAVRVESRITRLEEQDRMFTQTFENIDDSLTRIVILLEQGAADVQVERETRIRLSGQIDALTDRTERLSRFHEEK